MMEMIELQDEALKACREGEGVWEVRGVQHLPSCFARTHHACKNWNLGWSESGLGGKLSLLGASCPRFHPGCNSGTAPGSTAVLKLWPGSTQEKRHVRLV